MLTADLDLITTGAGFYRGLVRMRCNLLCLELKLEMCYEFCMSTIFSETNEWFSALLFSSSVRLFIFCQFFFLWKFTFLHW